MGRGLSILSCACLLFALQARANADDKYDWENLPREYELKLTRYRYPNPEIHDGDTMWVYLLPELPVYPPMRFKSEKQKRKYDRLVYNVQKVLPLAQQANRMLQETFETLETLPTKKEKDAHIKQVEHDIKQQFTPKMKKLSLTQGKLLIKLIDRECNQSSYQIIKAFLGPVRANFYQLFAWTFGASLKKEYKPDEEDAMVERIVIQLEAGQL